MNLAHGVDADGLPQWLVRLAKETGSSSGLVSSFEECCKVYNMSPADVLVKIANMGRCGLAYDIVDALLQIYPYHQDVKFSIFSFYCVTDDFVKGIDVAEDLLATQPDDPWLYYYLVYSYKLTGDREKVIHTLKQGYQQCARPIFYQSSASHSLCEHLKGAILEEIRTDQGAFPSAIDSQSTASLPRPLSIKTAHAQEIGVNAAVLSGTLAQTSPGGKYCFQYGEDVDNLEEQTPWQPVPPGVFSEVRDATLSTFTNWLCYGTSHTYELEPCAIKSKWPFAIDRNHLVGVGQITLLCGWRPSSLPVQGTMSPSLDLRGGEISFQVRRTNMNAWGGELVLGLGAFSTEKRKSDSSERAWTASQWMLSARPMPCFDTKDEEWDEITFDIEADPQLWSYGANNPVEQDNSDRYVYLSLAQMIAHYNGNVVMCQMFADEKEIPEGEFTLREGRIVYRDWSMVRNANGGELVSFPGQDRKAALKLTNGQYRGLSDGWNSVENGEDGAPNTFVWRLPEACDIDGIVLVQHPRYPTLLAQVWLRDGARNGRVIHAGLISLPAPGYDQPKRFFMPVAQGTEATHLEVTLMQGQNPEGVGLMGVEVFGQFTPQSAVTDPVSVCEDIQDLNPGAHLHYRLMYRDENGEKYGEIQNLNIPCDATPMLHTLSPIKHRDRTWLVQGNPMGLDTKVVVRFDGEVIAERPFGRGNCRRHTIVSVPQNLAKAGKEITVQAVNEQGSGNILSVKLS